MNTKNIVYTVLSIALLTLFKTEVVLAQTSDDFENDQQEMTVIEESQTPEGAKKTQIQKGKVKPRSGQRKVGEIYASDEKRLTSRVESLHLNTFAFGPGSATGANNNNMYYSLLLAKNWEVNEQAEIRASLFAALPSKGSGGFAMLGLGGSYFFSTSDVSPLVGLELGAATSSGGRSAAGFAGGVHLGLRFFRTAKTQMSLEAFYKSVFANQTPGIGGVLLAIHY